MEMTISCGPNIAIGPVHSLQCHFNMQQHIKAMAIKCRCNFSQLKNYNLPWHLPKLKHLRVIIWAQRYCTYPWHDTNKQQWRLWIFSFIHPFHQGQYVSFSWVVSKWSGPEISPVASCCVDFVDVQLFTLSQKNNPLPFSTRCVSFIPTIRATKTHTLSPLLRASHLFIM